MNRIGRMRDVYATTLHLGHPVHPVHPGKSSRSSQQYVRRMEHSDLTRAIIGCAMNVHRTLGPGFLEAIYGRALAHELRKLGIAVECEKSIQVVYDGVVVGDFYADMLVDGRVMVENKAVLAIVPAQAREPIHRQNKRSHRVTS